MADVEFIGISTPIDGGNDDSDGSCQPTWPASYTPTAGHYAVMLCTYSTVGSNSTPYPTPSDWALLALRDDVPGYDSGVGGIQAFGRFLAGSDTLPAMTSAGSGPVSVQTTVWANVDPTTPMDATPVTSQATSAAWQPTGITTVTDGAHVVSFFFNPRWNHSPVASGHNINGFTLMYSETMRVSSAAARIVRATAGLQSMPTWASDNDGVCHIALALRPAPVSATAAYTEVEWNIGIQAPAAAANIYEFRVYDGETPLEYDVTPQLTVAATGINYDETSRSITVTASVTETDQADWEELARAVGVAAVTTVAAQVDRKDLALAVGITATTTATTQADWKEPALAVGITATTAVTAQIDRKELSVSVPVVASTTATTQADFKDTLSVGVLATFEAPTQTFTHAGNFDETGLAVLVTATTAVLDRAGITPLASIWPHSSATDTTGWALHPSGTNPGPLSLTGTPARLQAAGWDVYGAVLTDFGGEVPAASPTRWVRVFVDRSRVGVSFWGINLNVSATNSNGTRVLWTSAGNFANGDLPTIGSSNGFAVTNVTVTRVGTIGPSWTADGMHTVLVVQNDLVIDVYLDEVRCFTATLGTTQLGGAYVGISGDANTGVNPPREIDGFEVGGAEYAGTNYSETGRSILVVAATAAIDQADWKSTGLLVPVAATYTAPTETFTHTGNYNETGRSVLIAATVTCVDTFTHVGNFNETGLSVSIAASLAATSQADWKEPGRSVPVAVTVTATDRRRNLEAGVSLPVVAVTTTTTQADFKNLALSVPVTAYVTATDNVQSPGHFEDTGMSVGVTATTTAISQADLHDLARSVSVVATVTCTDVRHYSNLGLSVPVVSTVTTSALVKLREPVSLVTVVTTTAISRVDLQDVLVLPITSTTTGFDQIARVGEVLLVSVAASVDVADRVDFHQLALPVPVLAGVDTTTVLSLTALLSIAVIATTIGTDRKGSTLVTVLNDADALYLGGEAIDRVYAGSTLVWP